MTSYSPIINADGDGDLAEDEVATGTIFDGVGRVLKAMNGVRHRDSFRSTDSAITYTYNLGDAMIEQQYPSGIVVKNTLDSTTAGGLGYASFLKGRAGDLKGRYSEFYLGQPDYFGKCWSFNELPHYLNYFSPGFHSGDAKSEY
ncbi:MAG: hypothetical protein KA956_07175 [Pyrinomonadaceae bacterium]|nr:hypothetical protein [Acidobacteriota bacterium]MBP7376242.1 hypothetical protein [Pyrinomonadaceae bacterium]